MLVVDMLTMVLAKAASSSDKPEAVLHHVSSKAGGELQRLGDDAIRPVSTRGKWLVYIRKAPGGEESACIAEIALPKK